MTHDPRFRSEDCCQLEFLMLGDVLGTSVKNNVRSRLARARARYNLSLDALRTLTAHAKKM